MNSNITVTILVIVTSLMIAITGALRMPLASARPADDLDPAMRQAVQMAEELLDMEVPITSGRRSSAKQQQLWDNRHNNPYPVAFPGTSRHELGVAIDVPSWFVPRLLTVATQVGICQPLPISDPIHFILCNDEMDRRQAGARSLGHVVNQLRGPGWQMWPSHDQHQVVGLPSWLFVTDNWETRTSVVSLGTAQVTTQAVPVESVWTFTEQSTGAVEVIRCPGRGNRWTPGASGMPRCGKAWTHSSDVTGSVEVGVEVVYQLTTTSSFGDNSSAQTTTSRTMTSRPGQTRDLLVGEVQTWGVADPDSDGEGDEGEGVPGEDSPTAPNARPVQILVCRLAMVDDAESADGRDQVGGGVNFIVEEFVDGTAVASVADETDRGYASFGDLDVGVAVRAGASVLSPLGDGQQYLVESDQDWRKVFARVAVTQGVVSLPGGSVIQTAGDFLPGGGLLTSPGAQATFVAPGPQMVLKTSKEGTSSTTVVGEIPPVVAGEVGIESRSQGSISIETVFDTATTEPLELLVTTSHHLAPHDHRSENPTVTVQRWRVDLADDGDGQLQEDLVQVAEDLVANAEMPPTDVVLTLVENGSTAGAIEYELNVDYSFPFGVFGGVPLIGTGFDGEVRCAELGKK